MASRLALPSLSVWPRQGIGGAGGRSAGRRDHLPSVREKLIAERPLGTGHGNAVERIRGSVRGERIESAIGHSRAGSIGQRAHCRQTD